MNDNVFCIISSYLACFYCYRRSEGPDMVTGFGLLTMINREDVHVDKGSYKPENCNEAIINFFSNILFCHLVNEAIEPTIMMMSHHLSRDELERHFLL